MSDARDKTEATSSDSETEGPLCGERLAAARREQEISVHEIAKELHLDEPKVRALERNEFETLGAPVFAKGHMRKYAQLVDVDEADVLADYYQLTRTSTIPPVVSSRPRPRREMAPGPWIAVIVVFILVATAYWWLTSRPARVDTAQPESSPEQQAVPEQESEQESVPEQETEQASVSVAEEEPAPAEPAASEPVQVESQPEPAPADGQLRMLITYSGDCWTEISDASGRRLFFGLGQDGRTVELTGEAPFNVLFGNADNVSLEVNGAEYTISAAERRGRTARMTIPGS